MPKQIHLLIIDPQKDFCDRNGSLYVTGADQDMNRVAGLIARLGSKLSAISVTLDSHHKVDISHPIWFTDSAGAQPAPFTVITAGDVRTGKWTTTSPEAYERTLSYLDALAAGGRYPHVIWPYHCLIGDEGHSVWPALAEAIHEWEDRFASADFITKGINPWTEHFSAVQAEVVDPTDPSTQVNTGLISTLESADIVLLAGEALSHCLANTVRDVASRLQSPRSISKLVLLSDASSNVPTFEHYGDELVRELTAKGMQVSTTKDFLAAA